MTMATIKHHTSETPDPSLSKIGRRKSSGAGRNKAPPPSPGVSRGIVKGGKDDGEVIGADSTRDLNNSIEDSQQVDNDIVGEDKYNQSSASIPQRRIMEVRRRVVAQLLVMNSIFVQVIRLKPAALVKTTTPLS